MAESMFQDLIDRYARPEAARPSSPSGPGMFDDLIDQYAQPLPGGFGVDLTGPSRSAAVDDLRPTSDLTQGFEPVQPRYPRLVEEAPPPQEPEQTQAPSAAAAPAETPQPPAERPGILSQAGTDLARGWKQLKGTGYGLAALGADIVGAEGARDWLLEGYQRAEDEAKALPAVIGSYKNIPGETVGETLGNFGRYAVEAVAENAAMFVPSLLTGGLGALVARKGAEVAVRKFVEAQVASGVARAVAERQAAQMVAKRISAGAVAGAYPSSAGMEAGSIYGDIFEETGERSPGVAASFGAAAGALDVVAPALALRRMFGPVGDAVMHGLVRRLGTEGAKQFLAEAPTELLQTIIEKAAVEYVDPTKKTFDPKNIDQFIDAFLKGGLAGAGLGVASEAVGSVTRPSAPDAAKETERRPPPPPVQPTPDELAARGAPLLKPSDLNFPAGPKIIAEGKAVIADLLGEMAAPGLAGPALPSLPEGTGEMPGAVEPGTRGPGPIVPEEGPSERIEPPAAPSQAATGEVPPAAIEAPPLPVVPGTEETADDREAGQPVRGEVARRDEEAGVVSEPQEGAGAAQAGRDDEAREGTGAGPPADVGVGAGPGTPLRHGFKVGPEPGTRYRATVVNTTGIGGQGLRGALALEKRNDRAETAWTFYVGTDGNLIDADNVALNRVESLARIWQPTDEARSAEALAILDEMGALALTDPRRKDLKQRLKDVVLGQSAAQPATSAIGDEGARVGAVEVTNVDQTSAITPELPTSAHATGAVVERDGSGWRVTIGQTVYRGDQGRPFRSEKQARAFAERRGSVEPGTPPGASAVQPAAPVEPDGPGSKRSPIKVQSAEDIATAGARADTQATDDQKAAGNYRLGHLSIDGIDNEFAIETAEGEIRKSRDDATVKWEVVMPVPYGYAKKTRGMDGDPLDVFFGKNPKSKRAFIIDQVDAETGKPDEHKLFVFFNSRDEVIAAYDASFSDGKGPQRRGTITQMSIGGLNNWLATGDHTRPLAEQRGRVAKAEAAAPTTEPPAAPTTAALTSAAAPERAASPQAPAAAPAAGAGVDAFRAHDIRQTTGEARVPVRAERGSPFERRAPEAAPPPPAQTEPPAAPKKEEAGPRRFEKGDRVVLESGRHGTVVEATHMRWQSVYGGASGDTSIYRVKTDQGTVTSAGKEMQPETGKAPEAVPDPVLENEPHEPDTLQRIIANQRGYAIGAEKKAASRRKDEYKRADLRTAAKHRADADVAERVLAAWIKANPEEAKRVLDLNDDDVRMYGILAKQYKTGPEEDLIKVYRRRAAADPKKFAPGMGVAWRVTRDQINRGFRIVSVDSAARTAVIRSVADTGLTTTGGDRDRIGDERVPLGDLTRERKYDAPTRETEAPEEAAPAAAAAAASGGTPGMRIVETKHTRDGYDLFVVTLDDRVSPERFKELKIRATNMKGWYSSFRGQGAVPGFQFKSRDAAERFMAQEGASEEKPSSEAKPPAATREERVEEMNRTAFQGALERIGAARWDGADWLIQQAPDGGFYFRKTKNGIRTERGPGPQEQWSREEAIRRAVDEAFPAEEPTETKPSETPQPTPATPETAKKAPFESGDMVRFKSVTGLDPKPHKITHVRHDYDGQWMFAIDHGRQHFKASDLELVPDEQAAPPPAAALKPTAEPPKPAAPAPAYGATNTVFTADRVEAARARLRAKLRSQLSAGVDPEILFDGITIGGFHIEAGARSFAAYSAKMIEDLGEAIRPFLRTIYNAIRDYPGFDATGMTPAAEIEAAPVAPAESRPDIIEEAAREEAPDVRPTGDDDRSGDAGDGTAPVRPPEGERPAEAGDRGPRRGGEGGALGGVQPSHDQDTGGDAGASATEQAGTPEHGEQGGMGAGTGGGAGVPAGGRGGKRARTAGLDGTVEAAPNFNAAKGSLKREGSWQTTAERNLDAIELLRKIETENRWATPDEQAALAKFTGWGAGEIRNNLFRNAKRDRQTGKVDLHASWMRQPWQGIAERAEQIMSNEDLQTALQSTQYAHYTSEPVIRSIWRAVERFGFKGGKILEPGMGTGLFPVAAPAEIMANSRYTGIELDRMTAGIAQQLLPRESILQADFVRQKLPDGFFDLAIGNPPFARTVITEDQAYRKHRFSLHDFFFAKSIDKVRPGGVVVFVTSRYTMDKLDDKARAYLAERADLVGAIRLPQTAFKANAGTEVVTDVLFLRKRAPGEPPGTLAWNGHAEVKTADGKTALINEYFAAHPEMVLGEHSMTWTMYGSDGYTVTPREGDIEEQFAKAVEQLPEGVYGPAVDQQSSQGAKQRSYERDFNPDIKKEGGVYLRDGQLMQVQSGSGVPLAALPAGEKLSTADLAWLKDYVPLRDAIKRAQADQLQDNDWEASLKTLNKTYEAFVKKHGHINAFTTYERKSTDEDGDEQVTTTYRRYKNERLWEIDIEGQLAPFLEHIEEDGTIVKGRFLIDRTLKKPTRPEIKSTQDAYLVSLDERGRLDLDHVAALAKKTRDEAIADLGDAIYETATGEWQTADAYLSGDVVSKLEEMRIVADAEPRFERNVKALIAAQPKPLGTDKIDIALGAGWVPTQVVEDFADEILGIKIKTAFEPTVGKWGMTPDLEADPGRARMTRRRRLEASARTDWGTRHRSTEEILDAALNNREIKIYVPHPTEPKKTVLDPVATTEATEKVEQMRVAFRAWIWTDSARVAELVPLYNRKFNNIAPRRFDGSHLTLPGLSLQYELFDHQKRAIWRVIQTGNTYLGHAVGAGKTLEMIVSAMEQRRLGLIRRPLFIVPNHMLHQFASEFLDAYPTANIMVASDKNFHTTNRQRFVAQAALNDPEAIIMTHSSFTLLGTRTENRDRVVNQMIADLEAAIDSLGEGQEARIPRQKIEQQIEAIKRRFATKADEDAKDQGVLFEDMGVDMLYVDEAHMFRKLDFATDRGNIKGIDPKGSARALDLYIKTRFLDQQRPGRSLVMASGTPVTNTMAELYTVMRFMDEAALEADNLRAFDAWAQQFGRLKTDLEQNAAGKHENVTRFRKIVNVPELMKRVREFMDILTTTQLGDLVKRPAVNTGQPQSVITQASDELRAFQDLLDIRIDSSRKWKPSPHERGNPDPLINIITDARLSGIDMRFVSRTASNDPESKLNKMIDKIIETHKATAGTVYVDPKTGRKEMKKGSTQIVFSPVGFGAMVAQTRGFDVRGYMMKRFADGGIRASEVAWMSDYDTDAKKQEMFKEMRAGTKRILIGSPANMGTGINVQKRLATLHFLAPPWYPADVEQPHGRILRQGNLNPSVDIFWYATKGTYDSAGWGMVAGKARMIEQAYTGDDSVRVIDDISEAGQYEMVSALAAGDERAMELVRLQAEVEKLERLERAHIREQGELEWEGRSTRQSISSLKQNITNFKKAEDGLRPIYGKPEVKIDGATVEGHKEAGEALLARARTELDRWRPQHDKDVHEITLGILNGQYPIVLGMSVRVKRTDDGKSVAINYGEIAVQVKPLDFTIYEGRNPVAENDPTGFMRKVVNRVNEVPRDLQSFERSLMEAEERLLSIESKLGTPFPRAADLAEQSAAVARLKSELASDDSDAGLPSFEEILRFEGEGGALPERPARPDVDAAGTATERYQTPERTREPAEPSSGGPPIDLAGAPLYAQQISPQVFGLFSPLPEYMAAREKIERAVAGLLQRIVGKAGVRAKAMDLLRLPAQQREVLGIYADDEYGALIDRIVAVALYYHEYNPATGKWDKLVKRTDAEMLGTARHEAIHFLREAGLLDGVWGRLEEAATRPGGWIETFNIETRYPSKPRNPGERGFTREQQIEEAIADAYAEWGTGLLEAKGMVATAFRRIQEFFANLRRMLSDKYGFRAVEDVFSQVERGGMRDGGRGVGGRMEPRLQSEPVPEPPFFSAMTKGVTDARQAKAPATQWVAFVRNLTSKGVKQEEILWSGVLDWLAEKSNASVTKDELAGFLRSNEVTIEEVTKGGQDAALAAAEEAAQEARGPWLDAGAQLETWLAGVLERGGKVFQDGTDVAAVRMPGAAPPAVLDMLTTLEATQASFTVRDENGNDISFAFRRLADDYNRLGYVFEKASEATRDLRRSSERDGPRYNEPKYTTPGGSNYRELLLTLPYRATIDELNEFAQDEYGNPFAELDEAGQSYIRAGVEGAQERAFTGGHFDEPNVIAHVRFNERTDADGKRVLFVEEVQSDWMQSGRQHGFKDETREQFRKRNNYDQASERERDKIDARYTGDVPVGPMRAMWHELAMKRVLRFAAENGFDSVAWTTGEMQADRYDLSKHIKSIEYAPSDDATGTYRIIAHTLDGKEALREDDATPSRISDLVGKEIADKIQNGDGEYTGQHSTWRKLSGIDLKVGGQGMKGFYDKILPDFLNRYGKKWGAKVGKATIGATEADAGRFEPYQIGDGSWRVSDTLSGDDVAGQVFATEREARAYGRSRVEAHSIDVTSAMRDSVMRGQPLFQTGWHGSPHDFDKFSTEKIGTGEGAQAYGWGLYFADKEDVARYYRDTLSERRNVVIMYGDVPIQRNTMRGRLLETLDAEGRDAAIQRVQSNIDFNRTYAPDLANLYESDLDWIKTVDPSKVSIPKGRLYKVDLAPKEEEYLDWDKPLSEQSAHVKTALRNSGLTRLWNANVPDQYRTLNGPPVTGEVIYRALSDALGSDKAASLALRDASIPGIRYLDQDSRSAGEGTSNYVIFDESMVKIEEKFQALPRGNENASAATKGFFSRNIERRDADKSLRERLSERIAELKDRFGRRMRQGLLDELDSLRVKEVERHGEVRGAEASAYKAAAATRNLRSVMHVVMTHGALEYRDGGFRVKSGAHSGGFLGIFKDVAKAGKLDDWIAWAVANRAERLKAEGRENLISDDDIAAFKDIDRDPANMAGGRNLFRETRAKWEAFNRDMLDMAQDAGLIDPEARAVWENEDYVPFYRAFDEVRGPKNRRGIAGQRSGIRTLRGGTAKLNDVLENMALNLSHLIDASFKNVAMQRTVELLDGTGDLTRVGPGWKVASVESEKAVEALEDIGVQVSGMSADQKAQWLKLFHMVPPAEPDVVSVMIDGKPRYYRVNDDLLLRSLTSLHPTQTNGLVQLMGLAKRGFTRLVTMDPSFMIANLIRDTMSARVVTGADFQLGLSTAKGFTDALKEQGSAIAIMAGGGGGGGFYHMAPDDVRHELGRSLGRSRTGGATGILLDSGAKLIRAWDRVGAASEMANRIAIYEDARRRGLSEAEATYRARDLLDFGMRGDFAAMRFMIEVVPFLNARLQGLYKLYRGATRGTPEEKLLGLNKKFLLYGALLAGASLALLASHWDDDDYWDEPEYARDNYYYLGKIDGKWVRLPKPFEVGAIFSTLPERIIGALGAKEEGRILGRRVLAMFRDTFAFNPVPQLFLPGLELWANTDTFTGRPIEGMGDRNLKPSARFNERTSEIAKLAGRALDAVGLDALASPKRIEHLIHGYTGTIGGYLLSGADAMARAATDAPVRPSLRVDQIPVLGRFVRETEPAVSTKWLNEFYELKTEIDEIYSTVLKFRKLGEFEAAAALKKDEQKKLKARAAMNGIEKKLQLIGKKLRSVAANREMTPEQKRDATDRWLARRNAVSKRVEQIRSLLD